MFAALLRFIESFSPRQQPLMSRQGYAYERGAAFCLPVAVAMIDGAVAGVLLKKVFYDPAQPQATELPFAVIMASPFMANLTSYFWATLARGKPKIALMNWLHVGLLLCIAGVAFLPRTIAGAWGLVFLALASRCLIAGAITIRSAIWRLNYPRKNRAQVTSKLVVIMSFGVAMAPMVAYPFLDFREGLFRAIYPFAACIGVVGLWSFSKIRVRREKELLREELAHTKPQSEDEAPLEGGFWSVLRDDRDFRFYQLWQFVLGGSNIMAETVVIYFIAHFTREHAAEYSVSIFLGTTIPMLVALALMPLWAKFLDRVHIAEFRTRHALFFVVTQFSYLIIIGSMMSSPGRGLIEQLNASQTFGLGHGQWLAYGLLLLPRVLQGVARGGGMLAWNLGHHDFADRRLVSIYMGIHVTLTGIRGAITPFLGLALMTGWSAKNLGVFTLPAFDGIGAGVFLVGGLGSLLAWFGFLRLYLSLKRRGLLNTQDD